MTTRSAWSVVFLVPQRARNRRLVGWKKKLEALTYIILMNLNHRHRGNRPSRARALNLKSYGISE